LSRRWNSFYNYIMKKHISLWAAVFSLFLCGCRTLGPAPSQEVILAASVEDIGPSWIPFAQDMGPGLEYFAGRVETPRLEFWALRADLAAPGLRIVVNGSALDQSGHILSTRVSSFVKRYGCIAGINANPFSPVSGWEGEDRRIEGVAVSGGFIAAPPLPVYDALVFYDDRRAAVVNQAALNEGELRRIRNAVGGFHIVLTQGALPERLIPAQGGKSPPRHPRSAAGLSGDGRFLYLLAVDGSRPGSVGATEAELGIMLRQLGALWGLNFDGGGSTALVLRDSQGRVKAVNTPIHRQIPGWERGVAICLGIALDGERADAP
jgi:hypothetical protein